MRQASRFPGAAPFLAPAVVLGIGLGAFVDGIVLHQILQWHHMATGVEPATTIGGLELNTRLDGLFHAAAWVVTLAGVLLLWRAIAISRVRPPFRLLFGGLLVGFAMFNIVEGVVNHFVLGLHHVREGPDAFVYDAAFLLASALLFVVGSALVRRSARGTGNPGTGDGEREPR